MQSCACFIQLPDHEIIAAMTCVIAAKYAIMIYMCLYIIYFNKFRKIINSNVNINFQKIIPI